MDITDKRHFIITACEKTVRTKGGTLEVEEIVSRTGKTIELLIIIIMNFSV